MVKVTKKDFPISSLFSYELRENGITLNLCSLKPDRKDHIKKAKNSIFWAIILFHKYRPGGSLKTIRFEWGNKQRNAFLPLLENQMPYFKIQFPDHTISEDKRQFVFKDKWSDSITRNTKKDKDIRKIRDWISGLPKNEEIQLYNSVTGNKIQLRFMGYCFAEWDGEKIVPCNNKEEEDVCEWAGKLINGRMSQNCAYFKVKEEHYLEARLLKELYDKRLCICGNKISPIFENSAVIFQFPALLRRGDPRRKENNPTYIDILAKSGTRPVVIELKIWKKKGSSRGEYAFEALSQVLSYYNYLRHVSRYDENFNRLEGVALLEWDRPILYVIINNIGVDKRADQFRGYLRNIRTYFQEDIEFDFIEIPKDEWENKRTVDMEKIQCLKK